MIIQDRGLILRTWPLRETSRIVSAQTSGNGKVRLVARGVRGPRSRAGASLEPGNEVELVFLNPTFIKEMNRKFSSCYKLYLIFRDFILIKGMNECIGFS